MKFKILIGADGTPIQATNEDIEAKLLAMVRNRFGDKLDYWSKS